MRKTAKKTSDNNTKSKHRAGLTFRMNVLFFSIFILFSILIFRLGYLQIVKGEDYVRALERTEEVKVNTSVPRGKIYDRNGYVLVDNQPEKAITYTKMSTTTTTEMLEVAEELATLIDVDTEKNTERDILDFWILRNPNEAVEKVTEEEINKYREQNPEAEESDITKEHDKRVRERITDAELATLTDYDMEVLAIYSKMRTGYSLSQQIIKGENVTDEEFALVSEHLTDLSGVNTTTDWKRVRLTELGILGRTTVPSKGIPKSDLDYYLAREYSRNDRVGESYLEKQYEELLQGEKSVVKNVTNKQGKVVETVTTFEGEPGKDLVTTIDKNLQDKVDALVESKLLEIKAMGSSPFIDRAFAVVMNPKTGEILAMVGKKIEYDEDTGERYILDYSYGAFTTQYEAGSSVKAATLLTGYSEGAVTPGQVIVDEPLHFGNLVKNSLFNETGHIPIDDLTALERSSNVYMFKLALAMGGSSYRAGGGINLEDSTLQRFRNGFAQFGLGVPTGIDLPGESSGKTGVLTNDGEILNLSIGQFDTYTPLQLAQYISTIANDGARVQPHILKEIRKGSEDGEVLGAIEQEIEPTILNRINNTQSEIEHVQEGLRRVYFGSKGTAASAFKDATFTAAGKTGTAQVKYPGPLKQYNGTDTINIINVGYAPFDDPEIAFAVIYPWATTNFNIHLSQGNETARGIIEAYLELQNQYSKAGLLDSLPIQKIVKDNSILLDEEEETETVNE